MADLSAFSNAQFDTTTWINNSFRDRPDEEAVESYLASLAMKLHIISQDYTDQLETGMVEAMTRMPRVLSDVARIEETLKNIEGEMQSLAMQLRTFDQRNVTGVEDLSRLDTLKSNMEKCKATLEEHARWSQVVREAKNFLESGGRLSDSADRIETMYRSLDILQNLPGHDERKDTCESLSDALLAALRPRVRKDIASSDLSPLHEYLYVYEKLGKKTELEEEYVQARPERLKGVWDKFAVTPTAQFAPWLALFLGKVAGLLSDESSHAGALFGVDRAPDVLCSLLQHALNPLAVPMAERLSSLSEGSPIPIAQVYGVTDEFARRVGIHLEGCSSQQIFQALTSLFAGFTKYLETYGLKEGQFLEAQLVLALSLVSFEAEKPVGDDDGGLNLDMSEGDTDAFLDPLEAYDSYGERLVAAADACLEPTEDAIQRAVTLMGGLQAKPVFRALSLSLAAFTTLLISKVDCLRVASGFESEKVKVTDVHGEAEIAVAKSWANKLEGGDLRGRALVTCALRALQTAGRLSKRIRELETLAAEALGDLSAALFRDVPLDKSLQAISQGQGLSIPSPTPTFASSSSTSNSVGALFACVTLQNNPSASSELKSFFVASASHHASQTVFASVSAPLSRLKTAAGALLFDLCTAGPERMVRDLNTEDVWCQGAIEYGSSGTDSSEVLSIHLTDNLLPLPAITQVGEHLLSLVQELETFASSDALPDLLSLTVGGQTSSLSNLSARGWKDLKVTLDLKDDEGVELLCKRTSCAAAVVAAEKGMFGMQLSKVTEDSTVTVDAIAADMLVEEEDEDAAALAFVNEWLGAIADSAVGLVVIQLVKIPSLSPQGRAQLVVDIEYISNVVQAMGLRQHPLLVHIRLLLLKDPAILSTAMETMPARASAATAALHRLDSQLSKALSMGHGLTPPLPSKSNNSSSNNLPTPPSSKK